MSIQKRLKEIRVSLDLKQLEVAEKFGIQQTAYSRYENVGIKMLPIEMLIGFNEEYNVNLNWLITGNGPRFMNDFERELDQKKADVQVKSIVDESELKERVLHLESLVEEMMKKSK